MGKNESGRNAGEGAAGLSKQEMRNAIAASSCFPAFLIRFDLAELVRRLATMTVALLAIEALSMSVQAQDSNNAAPFGPIGEVDVDQFMKFAKARGFDLQPELQRVYKKDEDALARLFGLSLKFKKFDRNARTYGQIMYSCWQKFGEVHGVDLYLKVLDRQPEAVQQRVRDFLYYPLLRMPKEKRKENQEEIHRMYPRLFPSDFKFGRNDSIF